MSVYKLGLLVSVLQCEFVIKSIHAYCTLYTYYAHVLHNRSYPYVSVAETAESARN